MSGARWRHDELPTRRRSATSTLPAPTLTLSGTERPPGSRRLLRVLAPIYSTESHRLLEVLPQSATDQPSRHESANSTRILQKPRALRALRRESLPFRPGSPAAMIDHCCTLATFSCDIAYSSSPTLAASTSARSGTRSRLLATSPAQAIRPASTIVDARVFEQQCCMARSAASDAKHASLHGPRRRRRSSRPRPANNPRLANREPPRAQGRFPPAPRGHAARTTRRVLQGRRRVAARRKAMPRQVLGLA